MKFHIVTLFPEAFSYLDSSILKRAQEKKKISVRFYNPRDFIGTGTRNKRKTVDDRPYGGGPGMVMKAEPILKAAEAALKKIKNKKRMKIVFFSPSGKIFTNDKADRILSQYDDIIFLSGHYEGIDERIVKILKAEKLSVGPYVLTGGELPAMIMIDAITRRTPGVLGRGESIEEQRAASSEVYTRPETLYYKGKKYKAPAVLLSGNHKKIEEWRRKKRFKRF